MSMCAEGVERGAERYTAGQTLGDCLVRGCTVFLGTIQTVGPPEKAPPEAADERAVMLRQVDVRVDQWLYGPSGASTVQLSHATRPAVTKTDEGPWVVWEGVALDLGGRLLVARWAGAPRPAGLATPEEVGFATSDSTLFVPAIEAIAWHPLFSVAPKQLDAIPKLLRDKQDDLFAGYFLAYLMNAESVRDVDNAAVLLGRLLGHESVPAPARTDIARWLASTFYRLGEPTRKTLTESLVILAAGDVAESADAALACLARLGELKLLDVRPYLTPDRRARLVARYSTYRAQRPATPPSDLDAQLGLR